MAIWHTICVNPANTLQRYIFSEKGFFTAIGGAPAPVSTQECANAGSTVNIDTLNLPGTAGARPYPMFNGGLLHSAPVVSVQIISWSPLAGYVLTYWKVYPFGAVTDPSPALTNPYSTNPNPNLSARYCDFYMNPAGNGQGYALAFDGSVYAMGGAPAVGQVALWPRAFPMSQRFVLDWTTKKYQILRQDGSIVPGNGATQLDYDPDVVINGEPPWAGYAYAKALLLLGYDTGALGWLVSYNGAVYALDGAQIIDAAVIGPSIVDVGHAVLIDDGSGSNPWRAAALRYTGIVIEITGGAKPFALAGGGANSLPADPTTTTNRPPIVWDYFDPDAKRQKSYEVAVLRSAIWDAAGYVNEVQTLSITGTATGGQFRISIAGQETDDIARNASAATVQTALEALGLFNSGDVSCAGGPLPGTPITITFQGRWKKHPMVLLVVSNAHVGVNEVQSLIATGATAGSFTLTFTDPNFVQSTTATMLWNSSAATVQARLEALPTIDVGDVVCTGGPLPNSAVTITFQGRFAGTNMTVLSPTGGPLTGGTPVVTTTTQGAPAVAAIARTTTGTGPDPATAPAVMRRSKLSTSARQVVPNSNLPNDTLRAYVRVTDETDFVSYWTPHQWIQNATAPAAPTLRATPVTSPRPRVYLEVTTPGSVAAGTRIAVQYRDPPHTGEWQWVRGAVALIPDGAGDATVYDEEIPFRTEREYRAFTYVASPFLASDADTVYATVDERVDWWITCPEDASIGQAFSIEGFDPVRPRVAGVFQPVGDPNAVVVTDGALKRAARFPLPVWLLDTETREAFDALIDSGLPLLVRGPFGHAIYFEVMEEARHLLRATRRQSEVTAIRDANKVEVEIQEVARPEIVVTDPYLVAAVEDTGTALLTQDGEPLLTQADEPILI